MDNHNSKHNLKNEEKLSIDDELLFFYMLQLEALINILERKGITSEDEVFEEMRKIKKEMKIKIKMLTSRN